MFTMRDGGMTILAAAAAALLGRPRFLGLFVPGGAKRLTVQYEPKPGSASGLC